MNSTGSHFSRDIYSYGNDDINVIVDTFSIDEPTPIYAYPMNTFSFVVRPVGKSRVNKKITINSAVLRLVSFMEGYALSIDL